MSGSRGADLAAALAEPDRCSWVRRAIATGPVEIRARGVSMRPVLRPGDRVRLEQRAPRRGDVALIALSERLILHRLIRSRGGRWLVRGDSLGAVDGWVHEAQIVGVATARMRDRQRDLRWVRIDRVSARARALVLSPARRAARSLRAMLPGETPAND